MQGNAHELLQQNLHRSIQKSSARSSFEKMASVKRGVFVVRLHDGGPIDHSVVLDSRKGVIYDSEECSAILLTAKNLMRCGGPYGSNARVHTVREIVVAEEIVL